MWLTSGFQQLYANRDQITKNHSELNANVKELSHDINNVSLLDKVMNGLDASDQGMLRKHSSNNVSYYLSELFIEDFGRYVQSPTRIHL